jgi:glycosyltransferase involved in cell wall biosynthesis
MTSPGQRQTPRAPAVSVILPTFNRLTYLQAAIASVFDQCFVDWELVIADDGSELETKNYLRTLVNRPRVKVLWLAHTGNPAIVRNAAVRESTGEYLAFLDSDDMWIPDKLQRQIASLRSRADRQWSYTGLVLVDGSGNPPQGVRVAQCPAIDGWILDPLLREEALVVTPSVIVHRDLMKAAGGFNETLLACEDYELWIRLASRSEVDFVDLPLVQVRRHNQHSFDDITCLEHLKHTLEMVQLSGVARHLSALLNERRAKISADLARGHALRKHRLRAMQTLWSSVRYSWRYRDWWRGALSAAARVLSPEIAWTIARRYRLRNRVNLESRA